MLALTQGKPLGPGDLAILVRDAQGALVTPTAISFRIFALVDGNPVTLMHDSTSAPSTLGQASFGAYFVNISVPTNWGEGQYRLMWWLQQYADSPVLYPDTDPATLYEDFQVLTIDPANGSYEAPSMMLAKRAGISGKSAELIQLTRELLSDNNPDRNYHFRPPTASKIVAGYSSRVGFIWTDQTIMAMLNVATAKLNWGNPKSVYSYTLETLPVDWGRIACIGAAALCLKTEAARWEADEFGYSLNGVSLDLNKAQGYQSLAESYNLEFSEMLPLVTANRPTSAGLRQQRWLLG